MKIENVAVISLEDYQEYQELKAQKNKVDVSKLKTGSVVRLKYTEQMCSSGRINYDAPFEVVFFKTPHCIDSNRCFYKKSVYLSYCTFYQNGNYILFSSHKNTDYITEVISY